MSERTETWQEVVASMRNDPIPPHKHDRELLVRLADRFEAAGKAMVPAALVVSTVRALLEGGSKKEKDEAVLRMARHFDENGNWQLGCYVRGLAQLEPTWVPMEAEVV